MSSNLPELALRILRQHIDLDQFTTVLLQLLRHGQVPGQQLIEMMRIRRLYFGLKPIISHATFVQKKPAATPYLDESIDEIIDCVQLRIQIEAAQLLFSEQLMAAVVVQIAAGASPVSARQLSELRERSVPLVEA